MADFVSTKSSLMIKIKLYCHFMTDMIKMQKTRDVQQKSGLRALHALNLGEKN